MKIKQFFILFLFVLCLSVSFAQSGISINSEWYLIDNSVEATYRNNQNIFIRIFASDTATLPTGDVGVIIKPYENFTIPADAKHYFIKTFSGEGELIVVNPYFKEVSVDVGSLSVEMSPSYTNQAGITTSGKVDSDRRVFVNIASETVGLNENLMDIKENVKPEPTNISTRTIELVANTNYEIVSTLSTPRRKFIEITAHDLDKEFTINFGGAAVIDSAGRKCFGGFGMRLLKSVNVNIISSESIKLNVIEGGY